MPEITLIEAVRCAMEEEMERDENVFLMGEDIGLRGGVFRATQGLLERYGPDRVIDAPLAELSIAGVGIGAALYGMRPICEIQFADFIHPAINQIVNEAAKMCYRSNGTWTVPLVIRAPYGGGIGGGLYHSQSVESLFAHHPGLKVVIPSNPYDAKGLLKSAVRDPNPVLFFEPKKGYRLIRGEVPDEEYTVPIGPAKVTRPGRDLSVFAYGMMHYYALQAAEQVASEGIDVEVVDLRTLYPVDRDTILESVRKTNKALIVYEDNLTGGYGAEIAALIAEHAFTDLDAPVRRLAGPDVPSVPYSHPLQDWFMLNPEKIAAAVRDLAAYQQAYAKVQVPDMAIKVIMPQLGESVVEGTVMRWLRQEGEPIHEFESLLEVNTDKVATEIPSPGEGRVLKILIPEGETVKAGTIIAWIGAQGEQLPGQPSETPARPPESSHLVSEAPRPAGRDASLGFISPIVARLAREENVELSQVKGTGAGGRITKKDVLDYLDQHKAAGVPARAAQAPPTQSAWETPADGDLFRPTEMVFASPAPTLEARPDPRPTAREEPQPAEEQGEILPLTPVRKLTAEHMLRSVRTAPHVTTVMEADLSRLAAHRQANQAAFLQGGVKLTYTPYFVAACVEALRAFPLLNSSWSETGIRIHPWIHIGLATSLGEEGLIVPVIKGADGLSLFGLARAVNDLAERARTHHLSPDEVQGGTFTLTNHGVTGSLFATPIIHQPQSAILGIGAIQKRVVVIADAIAIRPMAYLSLTFDHRVLDGAAADQFLAKVVSTLQTWPE